MVNEFMPPKEFQVFDNYPNPFNPSTTISYNLPVNDVVNVAIYDLAGRKVKTFVNGKQAAGFKSFQWNATNDKGKTVSAGVYLYTIQIGNLIQTRKMVLLK